MEKNKHTDLEKLKQKLEPGDFAEIFIVECYKDEDTYLAVKDKYTTSHVYARISKDGKVMEIEDQKTAVTWLLYILGFPGIALATWAYRGSKRVGRKQYMRERLNKHLGGN